MDDILIFVTGWTHVLVALFTKVEESFNLHATHDVLMYGIGIENLYNYDHFTFPGVVPRTFIGSVLLAWTATPIIWLAAKLGFVKSKFDLQILVRLILASLNAWTLCLIRRGVSRRFGRSCGLFFSLLTCSQFHLPFWMGRTIPNMFAMIPVNYSTYLLLDRRPNSKRLSQNLNLAITLLISTAIIFRAEIVLLLAPLCLRLLIARRLPFFALLKVVLVSGLISLALTVLVDSYFWDSFPLWPEFSGIYFNVFQGKSADWGTSPPLTYITSHLPKLLLGSLPLSIVGFLSDKRIRSLLLPACTFIGLISFLGHKEWRFIVYVVPIFNVAASRGARWMVLQKKSQLLGRLCFFAVYGLIFINIFFTALSTKASNANYPGGEALLKLQTQRSNISGPSIHISNLAAQTGATLFLQLHSPPYHTSQHALLSPKIETLSPWRYNKTENLPPSTFSASTFSFLISEIPETDPVLAEHWRRIDSVKGFDRWSVNWDLLRGSEKYQLLLEKFWDVLKFHESEKLWLLERKT